MSKARKRKKTNSGEAAEPAPEPAVRLDWRLLLLRLAACCATGVLIFTSFPYRTAPDTNIWPFAWIAFVPLLWALERVTPKQGWWLGWLGGTVTNFGGFWWIADMLMEFGQLSSWISWPLCFLNAAYQGLSFALFGYLVVKLRPPPADGANVRTDTEHAPDASIFRVAMIFTAVEFVFPMIFPWYYGNSQYRFMPAIQIADITGVMGVTFVLVAFNVAAYRVVRWLASKRRWVPQWRQVAVAVGLVVVTLVYGAIRIAQVDAAAEEAPKLKLGLVEADVQIWSTEWRRYQEQHPHAPPGDSFHLKHSHLLRHQRLSAELERAGVDLIVWPESSYFPDDSVMYIKRTSEFAVGVTEQGQLVLHRDVGEPGKSASFQWVAGPPVPQPSPGRTRGAPLRAVAAAHEGAIAAVGDGGSVLVSDTLKVLRVPYNGRKNLRAVGVRIAGYMLEGGTRTATFRLWAAGEDGWLLRGNRHGLFKVDVAGGSSRHLNDLLLFGPDDGIVVGDGGTAVAIRDGKARVVDSGASEDLLAVWAPPRATRAWIVGSRGVILRRDSESVFRREVSGVDVTLRDVAGTLDGEVFAVGDGGVILRRAADGSWARQESPIEGDLVAISADATGVMMVAERGGALWRATSGGAWENVEAPGLGRITAMAPVPYVRVHAMPRDARYLNQSRASLPSEEEFWADPQAERALPSWDRTAVQRGFSTAILYGGITWAPNPEAVEHDRRRAEACAVDQHSEGCQEEPHPFPIDQFNTAVMLDESGKIVGTYDKVYLLVFGEYIPLGEWFPTLYQWLPNSNRFVAGSEVRVFDWRGFRLGVMICYEDILAKFTGELADNDPNIILNVTNDAWFGKTSEPYLHLALAIFRAVENRLVLVRSTNTGVSAVIDPVGRITHQTSINDPETLIATVPMMDGGTIYASIGDAFSYGLLVWLFGIIAMRWWRRDRSANQRDKAVKKGKKGRKRAR